MSTDIKLTKDDEADSVDRTKYRGKAKVVADALSRKEQVKLRRVRAMAMTIQSDRRMILQPRVRLQARERTCKKATWFGHQMERKKT
ncbi:hypothetical protein Tco_1538541 [Tanacetum coccineum]